MDKIKKVALVLKKLIGIANKSVEDSKFDVALQSINAYASIEYAINQRYVSYEAEDVLMKISSTMKIPALNQYFPNKKRVLFYDGFGLDLRGWAVCYVRALANVGYELVYVTIDSGRGRIPHIERELNRKNCRIIYIDTHKSYSNWCREIIQVFLKYHPASAFFYTTPYDVSAATAFNCFAGKVQRFQIDLTDHAFWIGINAADIFLESRAIGASNSVYERGIDAEKIRVLDCCLYINRDDAAAPLPFDIRTEKYVFSGGALYKTLGDKELQYYKIIKYILKNYPDVKFLYAGSGDDTEMKKIISEFPNRAYLIAERTDFFRLFENCEFYLNTYPMFGGLMMRFAAYANKIPVTLKHNSDHEGILLDQEKRGIEFDSYKEITAEIDKLLSDKEYRRKKERNMIGSVLTEEQFRENLIRLIEFGETEFLLTNIEQMDTEEFRNEYISRLNVEEMLCQSIAKKLNRNLIMEFPKVFTQKILRRIIYD